MSAFTTVIVRISKTNTQSLTVGKKSAWNLIEYFRIQNWCFLRFWSWRSRRFRTERRNKFACSKISFSMFAMLFALIFPRAERVSTFDFSAERNVWLQSALRSFAIVCDYMETDLFAIVCDLRSGTRTPKFWIEPRKVRVMMRAHSIDMKRTPLIYSQAKKPWR